MLLIYCDHTECNINIYNNVQCIVRHKNVHYCAIECYILPNNLQCIGFILFYNGHAISSSMNRKTMTPYFTDISVNDVWLVPCLDCPYCTTS